MPTRRALSPHRLAGTLHLLSGILVFLCLSGGGPISNAAQIDTEPLPGPLADGVKLLSSGRTLEAIRVLNESKQSAPRDPRPYFYCGMAMAQAGRLQEAAAELGEAVHLAPGRFEYRVFQAHVEEQLKQTYAAENTLAVFQDAHALQQLSEAWLQLLADVYYRLQKTEESLRVLDIWAARDPHDARVDLFRGLAYEVQGKPDVALKYFECSLAKSDQNPRAYYELGDILHRKNQNQAARDALLKAVQQDEKNPEYRCKLASVYLALGDADAAIQSLQSFEPAGPSLPAIYYVLGRAYREKGDAALSQEYARKFQQAEDEERNREARRLAADRPIGQAQRQLDQGHAAEARVLFEKALEVDPDRWEPNAYLAEMDLNSGKPEAAYPHLERLERLDPDSAIVNFLVARYWFQQENYDRARVYAEKVRVSRPDNSELRALLGDIYLKLGEKRKALDEYEAAARLAPERFDLRERLQKAKGDGAPAGEGTHP